MSVRSQPPKFSTRLIHRFASPSREARASIGYLPESAALYGEMRVREYLRFRAKLEGVSGDGADGVPAVGPPGVVQAVEDTDDVTQCGHAVTVVNARRHLARAAWRSCEMACERVSRP
mgnify:CR=1 FL=1